MGQEADEGGMSDVITYAVVGGPPADWQGLKIIDLDTGDEVRDVVEVNTTAGWLIRAKRDASGSLMSHPQKDEVERERLTGRFEIRQP